MKVVIAGGGTGGHLFPGIALAEELKRKDEAMDILFIGTERGIEARILPRSGYAVRFISARGVLGRTIMGKAASVSMMMLSACRLRSFYGSFKPDVVVGTGGYASVAPVMAAWSKSVPTLIMEQNIVPGVANKLLGKIASAIAVTYHESMAQFPRPKTYLTGNPVRSAVLNGDREAALRNFGLDADKSTVLIFGGSAGARRINEALLDAMQRMLGLKDRVQFIHQTGETDFESINKMYLSLGYKAVVMPFIHEMADAYAASDLVISRSGATTLAELTALGKPSILIPYPHALAHQEFNARKLVDVNGARMIKDHELNGKLIAEAIAEILGSEDIRLDMKRNALGIGRPEAAQKVAELVMSLARNFRRQGGGNNV